MQEHRVRAWPSSPRQVGTTDLTSGIEAGLPRAGHEWLRKEPVVRHRAIATHIWT